VTKPTAGLNIQMSARQVDEAFNPAVGFVTRRGYRRYQPSVEYGPRPRNSTIVRRYAFSTAVDVQTDMQNDLLTRAVDLKVFDINFQSQDSFSVTVSNTYERLDEPFPISPGITLPVGAEYTTNNLALRASTANRRACSMFAHSASRRIVTPA